MRTRLLAALIGAALFAGCASAPKPVPVDAIVLLPDADGKTGVVVVKQGEREVVLDSAYASARSGGDGVPVSGRETAATVKKEFGAALAALPVGAD